MLNESERITRIVKNRQRTGKTTATIERLQKVGEEGFEHTQDKAVQRVVSAPLDRLFKAGFITRREYEAGDQYRTDAYLASIDPAAPTVDWNSAPVGFGPRSPAMFNSQRVADARIRWRKMEKLMPKNSIVGVIAFLGLIREQNFEDIGRAIFAIRDARELVVAARCGLRVALAALADHYENQASTGRA